MDLYELQKQVCVNVDGAPLLLDGGAAGKQAAAPKPLQKKANDKPRIKVVFNKSSDTQEEDDKAKKENPVNKKKDGEGISRKKAAAFTSVLTARSKVTILLSILVRFYLNVSWVAVLWSKYDPFSTGCLWSDEQTKGADC